MRVSRTKLVSESQAQVFHVVSRVVDKRFIFEDQEKGYFLSLMRNLESYTGVEVLSYCLMGNHFHLLLHIPVKPKEISIKEIRKRMRFIYSEKKVREFDSLIEEKKSLGINEFEDQFYNKQRARMFNLSSFMKEIKERFTKWYNPRVEREGTLWESRFKSLLVANEEGALLSVAAYIELNPVRAGIVDQPHEYRWCSYTEAVAGGKRARTGISKIFGILENSTSWEKASARYRGYFIHKGTSQGHRKKGFTEEFANHQLQSGNELTDGEVFRTRMRYFTDGLVIGSKHYLEEFLEKHRDVLGDKRKGIGARVEGSDLYSYRDVR